MSSTKSSRSAVAKHNYHVVNQVFHNGVFPDHLKPPYTRLIQEINKQYAVEPFIVKAKMLEVVCKYLTLYPTKFRIELSEVAHRYGLDEEDLNLTLQFVKLTVTKWMSIFAEETAVSFLSRDQITRNEVHFVRKFMKSLDFQSISKTLGLELTHLTVATCNVFRRRKGLVANTAFAVELSGSENFSEYDRAYFAMVNYYAKKTVERKPVQAIVKPEWCQIEPGITPGTKVPGRELVVDAVDPIYEYGEKLHTPHITRALAGDLFIYISAVRCFLGREHKNLRSIYLACLFLAERDHGTGILYKEAAMIFGEPARVLEMGIDEFEILFPRLRFFNSATFENEHAITVFAQRLRFTKEQVLATRKFSSEFAKMFDERHFLTRASAVLYIKGLEFGRPKAELKKIVPAITFVTTSRFNNIVKDVHLKFPWTKSAR